MRIQEGTWMSSYLHDLRWTLVEVNVVGFGGNGENRT